MGRAVIPVAVELLGELLDLPAGSMVGRVYQNVGDEGTVRVVVSHTDLPEVGEGDEPLEISPMYFRETDGAMLMTWWDAQRGLRVASTADYFRRRIAQLRQIFEV